jgi:succinate dehydrogenase flavin-adding protein (antitoxin of CptAB toxin-antitoxin module)
MVNLPFLTQDISAELGLDGLSAEEQQKTLQKVGDIIFQRVMMRVIDELDEKSKEDLDKLLAVKKNDAAAMMDFMRAKLPSFDDLVMEEVAGFKKETIELMRAAKGK